MPTLAEIREGLAGNLVGLAVDGVQVSAYMLANPTPPTIHLYPAGVQYDLAFGRGLDEWTFTVQAFVGLTTDIGAQQKLDELLAPSGPRSVKAALETDKTLGGTVDDLRVVAMRGYQPYQVEGRGPVFGAEWEVVVEANGAAS